MDDVRGAINAVKRVAILEPSLEHRELFISVVGHLGLEPVVPDVGVEPLAVDLIIVDVTTDAQRSLAIAIRRRNPQVAVIATSIYGRAESVLEELEPLAFLEKPFGIAELERAIHEALAEAA